MMTRRFLSTSVAMLAAFTLQPTVFAQSAEVEEVVVTGVRYSLTRAVDIKRDNVNIVDAIVSEDIGKFPDSNVVEAMQRIPGVQVTNRGAGEVSTVSIRGLSDVTTTINGRNIFTSSGRSVALADIPATLVNRVDVYKTRSAENIARGIAGQIDVHTNRPFDFDDFKILTQVRGIYQEQADEIDPNIAFLVSDRWDTGAGEFGALFNASFAQTNWLDQGVHAGASVLFRLPDDPNAPLERLFPPLWEPGQEFGMPFAAGSTLDDGTPYVHSRDAVFEPHVAGERERPAWNLALQWAPTDNSEYVFEAFYNGYENTQHNSLFFTFVDWWGSVDPNDPVEIYDGTNIVRSRYVNFPYTFISGDVLKQKTDSYLYALGGEWLIGDNLTLKSEVVFQDSEFQDDFFALRMDKGPPRLFVDFNRGSGVPYVEFFDDPNTAPDESDMTDAAQYNFAELYDNSSRDSGDAFTWTIDGDLAVDWGWINTLSFGARYDDRGAEENSSFGPDLHCNAAPGCAGMTEADFPGLMGLTTGHFDGKEEVLSGWAIPTQDGLLGNQVALRNAYGYVSDDMKVFTNEFNIDETKTAAYVQADFSTETDSGFVDGRFGVRWLDQTTDMSFPNLATGGVEDASNSNSVLLPSLMVRWGITQDLIARLSYTETFNLPTFPQLNPYINYTPDVTNIGYGTATGGNQFLEPIESENLDLSLEWYFAEGSVLYATWFQRDIGNNVVDFRNPVEYDDPNDNPDRGLYTYILAQPDNAGKATLDGWEFGVTYFPELDGFLSGIGFQGSYTILDSEQEIPVLDELGNVIGTDVLPLFGVSDTSYSAILAYDREQFSARLSYFWRDKFIDRNEAALFANPLAIYKSPEQSLDFQATWMINDNWTVMFDATNLTEEVFHENYGDNPQIFNFLNHLYSRTFAIGVRFQM